MLRIDSNILWTIINLLILYALMKHFLFQPVHDILEKRKQEIIDTIRIWKKNFICPPNGRNRALYS